MRVEAVMNRAVAYRLIILYINASFSMQAFAPQRPKPARSSEWLVTQIRHALLLLPNYTVFDSLEYTLEDYDVTLLGQVTKPTLKTDAANTVEHIEGVRKDTNQIEVLPFSATDDQIRRAVYSALFAVESPLMQYSWGAVQPIHIIVKNGRVTLVGMVANDADKTTAALLASKIPGIFSLTNNLEVAEEQPELHAK